MNMRRILVPILCTSSLCTTFGLASGATGDSPGAQPWSESFTMTLKDSERTFVVFDGTSYLVLDKADLDDRVFTNGKDVMLAAKFERGDGTLAHFYNLPRLDATAGPELWATRLDGDNLFVFGRVTIDELGRAALAVDHVAEAPSDNQMIADRLAAAPENDYEARLKVAEWARSQAAVQGNRDLWTAAADTIISQVVESAARQAADTKDPALLLRAVDWSLALIHDRTLAARICSSEWVKSAGNEVQEEVGERMRRLDFVFYRDHWRAKPDALTLEYEDRFADLKWRDAEGYYKLGRWAEANVEVMPHARELAHRCYQSGFRGDPRHNGIRRELGLEPVSGGSARSATLTGPYQDPDTGVVLEGPEGWVRSDPIEADATWLDPQSETAYLSGDVLMGTQVKGGFDDLWSAQTAIWVGKPGFEKLSDEAVSYAAGSARRMSFTYREARYARQADLIIAHNAKANVAVALLASYTEGEKDETLQALLALFSKVVIPDARQPDAGAPGQPGPGGPGRPQAPPGTTPPGPNAPR
ncbi:MAG: hypothetical protein H0X45_08750, partial [Planctomycetes bacterium]|nr:hypothetical protein [Planctomycetota bacterium]